MARKIFVNLPVKDVGRSMAFFTALGFVFDPGFTDDRAACMVISEDAYVMLLAEACYKTLTDKDVVDAATQNEAIVALSAESRAEVDHVVENALANGGGRAADPVSDGPMYGWSFQDVDGHLWELIHMDVSGAASGAAGPSDDFAPG